MPADFEAAVPSGDPDYIGALEMWDRFMGILDSGLIWTSSHEGSQLADSPTSDVVSFSSLACMHGSGTLIRVFREGPGAAQRQWRFREHPGLGLK